MHIVEDDIPKIDQIIQSKVYEDTDVIDDDNEDIQAIAVRIMILSSSDDGDGGDYDDDVIIVMIIIWLPC